jgi:hypothetical protein
MVNLRYSAEFKRCVINKIEEQLVSRVILMIYSDSQ